VSNSDGTHFPLPVPAEGEVTYDVTITTERKSS
jgi:hypothetical protein